MRDGDFLADRLTDTLKQFVEPRDGGVERFATLDARELDRAQDVVAVLVVADDTGFTTQAAIDHPAASPGRLTRPPYPAIGDTPYIHGGQQRET